MLTKNTKITECFFKKNLKVPYEKIKPTLSMGLAEKMLYMVTYPPGLVGYILSDTNNSTNIPFTYTMECTYETLLYNLC